MSKERLVLIPLLLMAILPVTECKFSMSTDSGDLISWTRDVKNFETIALSGFG
jgi:hypothetical protein